MTNALRMILDERERQIKEEGWSQEHDAEHVHGELALAAMCYVLYVDRVLIYDGDNIPICWPWTWDSKWWKPKDMISNLVRAGALYVAEHDRRMVTGENNRPIAIKIDQVQVKLKDALERWQDIEKKMKADGCADLLDWQWKRLARSAV